MPHDLFIKAVDGLPDGLKVPFITDVSDDTRCRLCNAVTEHLLSDPRGHVYCNPCIDVLTDNDGMFACADCSWNGSRELLAKNWKVAETVRGYIVLCPKQCSFECSLQELKEHYKYCGAAKQDDYVSCPLCQKVVQRREMGAHCMYDCPMRPELCPFCNCEVAISNMEHHKLSCDWRPAACKHCGEEGWTYKDLRERHLPICPLKPRPCVYKPFGCTYEGLSSDLQGHRTQVNHVELVHRQFQRVEAVFKESEKHFKDQHRELRVALDEMAAKNMTLEDTVQQLEKKLEESSHKLAEMSAKFENMQQGMQTQVKKNEESVVECQQSLHEAMKQLVLIGPEFTHIWKVQPYSHLRRATTAAENKDLSSTVVSTGSPGYRLMFSCNITGQHLSVFMKIHSGEDDDLLPWPFTGRVIVTLKNQTDPQKDIDKVIVPQGVDTEDCFKKPESCGYNCKFGFNQFIGIPVLENERKGFLVNDCIILQFKVLPAVNPPPLGRDAAL